MNFEHTVVLDLEKIKNYEYQEKKLFGNWILNDVQKLATRFRTAQPYPHVIIDNFFNEEIASKIVEEFPHKDDKNWLIYYNPIEHKKAINDLTKVPNFIKDCIEMLNHPAFINKISEISGITGLLADEYLHGGGIHCYPKLGKLNTHLDYSIHPATGKERRLNLIIYINKDWNDNWGGNLEISDDPFNPQCSVTVKPSFNSALLFQTCDSSYHGIPNLILCPQERSRNSLAVYYVTDPREGVTHRPKAKFYASPHEKDDEKLRKLLEIRAQRRISKEDLQEIYPDWEQKFFGKDEDS